MKLSTKSRYGARAMMDLAVHYREHPQSIREIAQRTHISTKYLESIMSKLALAGLVHSTRGPGGGFMLANPPQKIRLSEIVQTLEGSLAPVSCVDNPSVCSMAATCVTCEIWGQVKKAILNTLESISLSDMVVMREKKSNQPIYKMYYI